MTGAKFCDFEKIAALFLKYWDKYLIDGVGYTLALSAITVAGGVVLASLLALMKMSRIAPLRWISSVYIEIIRGTPMLLQLYFFYFGLPMLIPALNKQKFVCIAIALICNSAAYVSEVIRSGIQAVDPGQREAALSLGFSSSGAMWYVIMPQAIKNILPALGNEFIMIIKDTSLASTFFIGDLMTQYLLIRGATYLSIEPLVIAGVIYFIMTFALSKLFGHFEHKMQRSDRQSGTVRQRKLKREGAVA
ncbi:MAG: amino acid ABC transporter permease [Angelakisella sp.]|nr:amino acid ABC transporter permease [Angelakisella sp.]